MLAVLTLFLEELSFQMVISTRVDVGHLGFGDPVEPSRADLQIDLVRLLVGDGTSRRLVCGRAAGLGPCDRVTLKSSKRKTRR
jgi:hypothetical protein